MSITPLELMYQIQDNIGSKISANVDLINSLNSQLSDAHEGSKILVAESNAIAETIAILEASTPKS